MSEYTANAYHDIPEICFGDMQANEMGIEIPPQYAGRMHLNGKDYLIIPLENNKTKEATSRKTKKRDLGDESQDMTH